MITSGFGFGIWLWPKSWFKKGLFSYLFTSPAGIIRFVFNIYYIWSHKWNLVCTCSGPNGPRCGPNTLHRRKNNEAVGNTLYLFDYEFWVNLFKTQSMILGNQRGQHLKKVFLANYAYWWIFFGLALECMPDWC